MALKKITHVFSIFMNMPEEDPTRKAKAVERFRRIINSAYIRERLTLGELYGYLNKRPLADDPENPPAFRINSIKVDDNGNVTLGIEVLDTPTGEAMADLESRNIGGFVWSSMNGRGVPDFWKFTGIDYQQKPLNPLV